MSKSEKPWLYAEVHKASSLDDVLRAVFSLSGLPAVESSTVADLVKAASSVALGFLSVHVHQSAHILDTDRKSKLTYAQLSAWDLSEEVVHELLVGCLLARLRLVPQGIPHLRRSLELMIEAAFLSTTFVESRAERWSPFGELYLADLWQHYTSARSLGVTEFGKAARREGYGPSEGLKNFTTVYLRRFTTPLCKLHLNELSREYGEKELPEPIWHGTGSDTRRCSRKVCNRRAEALFIDRPASFALMRDVVKAKLGDDGYSGAMDSTLRRLYAKTSGYVHVTREAHRHDPEWSENELRSWTRLLRDLTAWVSRISVILFRWHGVDLPGLGKFVENMAHDFSAVPPRTVLMATCQLYSPDGFLGKGGEGKL